MGIPFQVLAPNHGIAATIKGGLGEGKTLVLRADIDALPVQEETGLELPLKTQALCMPAVMTPMPPCF